MKSVNVEPYFRNLDRENEVSDDMLEESIQIIEKYQMQRQRDLRSNPSSAHFFSNASSYAYTRSIVPHTNLSVGHHTDPVTFDLTKRIISSFHDLPKEVTDNRSVQKGIKTSVQMIGL